MYTRTTLTALLLATAAITLTACSSSSDSAAKPSGATPSATPSATTKAASKVDCSDPNLSQADWIAHCDKQPGKLSQPFGHTYTWHDGVKVTVTQARVFTAYDKSLDEKPDPSSTDYQVMIRVTNGGHAPLDLSGLSVITAGATNGGQAEATSWNNSAPGLEGRLAPGVTVTKADSESLATKFGRKIVVTVQRMAADNTDVMAFPEFTGSITG